MANNITNELTFKNCSVEHCREILEAIQIDDIGIGSVDFNKIIPQPEGLYMGDLGIKERELYKDNNWYDWRCMNWGTKWNSYGYEDGVAYYEDKNQIFRPKISITKKDLEEIPELQEIRDAIHIWEDIAARSSGRDAYVAKKAIIELRKD